MSSHVAKPLCFHCCMIQHPHWAHEPQNLVPGGHGVAWISVLVIQLCTADFSYRFTTTKLIYSWDLTSSTHILKPFRQDIFSTSMLRLWGVWSVAPKSRFHKQRQTTDSRPSLIASLNVLYLLPLSSARFRLSTYSLYCKARVKHKLSVGPSLHFVTSILWVDFASLLPWSWIRSLHSLPVLNSFTLVFRPSSQFRLQRPSQLLAPSLPPRHRALSRVVIHTFTPVNRVSRVVFSIVQESCPRRR